MVFLTAWMTVGLLPGCARRLTDTGGKDSAQLAPARRKTESPVAEIGNRHGRRTAGSLLHPYMFRDTARKKRVARRRTSGELPVRPGRGGCIAGKTPAAVQSRYPANQK